MSDSIGHKIKLVRQARQVSQLELSKRVGIDNTRLSLIENGHINPTAEQLARIREALGWTPELDEALSRIAAIPAK